MAQRKVFESDDEDIGSESEKLETAREDEHSGSEQDHLLVESDSEDDAPDDVQFKVSKQETLTRVKDALKQIETDKRRQKDKRKQKDDRYKLQKKSKLERLEQQRLPEDFLAQLETKQNKKTASEETGKLDVQETGDERLTPSDNDDSLLESDSEDYIALDSNNPIKPVYVKDISEGSKSAAQLAADFRNQALYGNNRVKREPVKEALAKKAKRKARFL